LYVLILFLNFKIKMPTEKILSQINKSLIDYKVDFLPNSMAHPYKYFIENGGKRVRPLLSILTTLLTNSSTNTDYKTYIDLANSIELMHTFTLLHDDIMDDSPLRRGKPTVHIKWNNSTAILLGDMMIGVAYKKLSKYSHLKQFNKILTVYNDALIIVCQGQALDIDYNYRNDIYENDYMDMIDKKTANLLKAAIQIGALASNTNSDNYQILSDFATNLGLAFQIQDDYLDLFAKGKDFGKSIGQDLVEGKKTLMIIKLNEIAEGNDKSIIDDFYKKNGCNQDGIQELINLILKYDIDNYVKNKFTTLYQKAEQNLEIFINNNNLQNNIYSIEFKKLLTKIINRNN